MSEPRAETLRETIERLSLRHDSRPLACDFEGCRGEHCWEDDEAYPCRVMAVVNALDRLATAAAELEQQVTDHVLDGGTDIAPTPAFAQAAEALRVELSELRGGDR